MHIGQRSRNCGKVWVKFCGFSSDVNAHQWPSSSGSHRSRSPQEFIDDMRITLIWGKQDSNFCFGCTIRFTGRWFRRQRLDTTRFPSPLWVKTSLPPSNEIVDGVHNRSGGGKFVSRVWRTELLGPLLVSRTRTGLGTTVRRRMLYRNRCIFL